MAQGFLYVASGLAVIVIALALAVLLFRVSRTMAAVEELVSTTTEEMRETLPEVRQTIGNVNDITASANLALKTVGAEAQKATGGLGKSVKRVRIGVESAAFGVRTATEALWRTYTEGGFKSGR